MHNKMEVGGEGLCIIKNGVNSCRAGNPLPALVFTLKVVVPAPGHGTRNFRSYYVPRPSTTQLASLAARAETRSNRVVILLGAWVLAGSTDYSKLSRNYRIVS